MPGSARSARVDAGIDGALDPPPKLVADLSDDVGVVRLLLHRARRAAHVHRDVGGARFGDDGQHAAIGRSARNVVHHPRARIERGAGDRRLRRVDAHGNRGLRRERPHHRQDPAQLFVVVDRLRSRARRLTPDVDHRRAGGGQREAVRDRGVGVEIAAAVGERVGVTLTIPIRPRRGRSATRRRGAAVTAGG